MRGVEVAVLLVDDTPQRVAVERGVDHQGAHPAAEEFEFRHPQQTGQCLGRNRVFRGQYKDHELLSLPGGESTGTCGRHRHAELGRTRSTRSVGGDRAGVNDHAAHSVRVDDAFRNRVKRTRRDGVCVDDQVFYDGRRRLRHRERGVFPRAHEQGVRAGCAAPQHQALDAHHGIACLVHRDDVEHVGRRPPARVHGDPLRQFRVDVDHVGGERNRARHGRQRRNRVHHGV